MSAPFQSFQQGLMTGAQMGQGAYRARGDRQVGGLMASGDTRGAMAAAYGQGDLRTGLALQGQVTEQAGRERQGQIVGALKTGDVDGAMAFVETPEELNQLQAFKANATEQQRAEAVQKAEQLYVIATQIEGLPADQQFAAAQQAAAALGMDPNSITPDMVTPQQMAGLRVRALGLKDFLTYEQKEREALRPIIGNGFISLPPGSAIPGGQAQVLDALPPGARIRPRPNQPPSAPAAGGGERSQQPRVSFRSSNEARQSVERMIPGVSVTNADRTPADTARLRRQGYNPSDTSFHLEGRALDLVPPRGMSMAQLAAKMRQAGFRVVDESRTNRPHIHVSW